VLCACVVRCQQTEMAHNERVLRYSCWTHRNCSCCRCFGIQEFTGQHDWPSAEGRPPANVCLYVVTHVWPSPWPHDLDIRTWPRYYEDVLAYQKWSFEVGADSKVGARRETDDDSMMNNTDARDRKHCHAAFSGGRLHL